jgi:hypothetical protein
MLPRLELKTTDLHITCYHSYNISYSSYMRAMWWLFLD